MATATFQINTYSNPKTREFHPDDIEMGMDADAGVKSTVTKDSAWMRVTVDANFAGDAANWLKDNGLI